MRWMMLAAAALAAGALTVPHATSAQQVQQQAPRECLTEAEALAQVSRCLAHCETDPRFRTECRGGCEASLEGKLEALSACMNEEDAASPMFLRSIIGLGGAGGFGPPIVSWACPPGEDRCNCSGHFDCLKMGTSGCCKTPTDTCETPKDAPEVCYCPKASHC
jgi:hypothetical protein